MPDLLRCEWWSDGGSNPGPSACHADALPAELSPQASADSSSRCRHALRSRRASYHRNRVVADAVPEATPYLVRRSTRARRSRITISDSGEVVVVLPMGAPAHEAARLVGRHAAWIERHLERIVQRRRALAVRPSLAWGRPLLIGGQLEVVCAVSRPERQALERRLRRVARRAIEANVERRSAEMGIAYGRITVRDQRTRWGSASRTGTLSFSWRLILCPPEVLDYVVVHELAHLRHAGHGKRFWALVEQHHADVGGARRWLRANHDAVRQALD